jgi:GcrA cell cycle regulator
MLRFTDRKTQAMDWTDEVIAQLKLLWAEGHSTAEIGRRMSISKNAVVGKAHRLTLEARPSPIRRGMEGETSRRSLRRSVGPTLPPLVSRPAAPETAQLPQPPPAQARIPVLHAVARSGGSRSIECCWPIGEPGTKSFRFCDAGSLAGKPYCAEHAQLAYVKVRDRREDAA